MYHSHTKYDNTWNKICSSNTYHLHVPFGSYRKFTGDIYRIRQLYKGEDNHKKPCREHEDINLSYWQEDPAYVVDSMPSRALPERYYDDVRLK